MSSDILYRECAHITQFRRQKSFQKNAHLLLRTSIIKYCNTKNGFKVRAFVLNLASLPHEALRDDYRSRKNTCVLFQL